MNIKPTDSTAGLTPLLEQVDNERVTADQKTMSCLGDSANLRESAEIAAITPLANGPNVNPSMLSHSTQNDMRCYEMCQPSSERKKTWYQDIGWGDIRDFRQSGMRVA